MFQLDARAPVTGARRVCLQPFCSRPFFACPNCIQLLVCLPARPLMHSRRRDTVCCLAAVMRFVFRFVCLCFCFCFYFSFFSVCLPLLVCCARDSLTRNSQLATRNSQLATREQKQCAFCHSRARLYSTLAHCRLAPQTVCREKHCRLAMADNCCPRAPNERPSRQLALELRRAQGNSIWPPLSHKRRSSALVVPSTGPRPADNNSARRVNHAPLAWLLHFGLAFLLLEHFSPKRATVWQPQFCASPKLRQATTAASNWQPTTCCSLRATAKRRNTQSGSGATGGRRSSGERVAELRVALG